MAQTIKLKRSAATGNVPTAAQIDLGELAINTTDGRVYMKKGDNSILTLNPMLYLKLQMICGKSRLLCPSSGGSHPAGYVWYIV